MGCRETSLAAYDDLRDSGKVGKQAQTILNHLQPGGNYSLQEICRLTGLPINAVSGRVNDLKKIGLLAETDKRFCSITGRLVQPVKLPTIQRELF